ncbi:MAG: GspE/PulE family protein [Planctomycetia bacterium]
MHFDDLLVRHGLLTVSQLEQARAASAGRRLDQTLVALGFVDEDQLLAAFGEAMGMDVVSLADRAPAPELLAVVPPKLIFRRQVFPIERRNGTLRVATRDPFDLEALDDVHEATGLHIEPVLARGEEIAGAIKKHFGVGGETVGALVGRDQFQIVEDGSKDADADELAEEASVVRLVNEILQEAIEQRTSDVHIEPARNGFRLRYRIDGVLQVQSLPPAIHRFAPAIVSRLKIMARLNIAEKRLPQDGRIQLRGQGRDVDIRVSIIPMAMGEGVVLRILDKGRMKFSMAAVGMSGPLYSVWTDLITRPHGILLVTGPTGSGKTTTLYSALSEIADDETKIITCEDPVEYQFDGIQQIEVHTKIGLTFAAGLRSILRHDPDVVLIGEIRDRETAEIATQAALTGHLVFSTLHTNDAAGAFTRLTDMGVEPFLVASTVEAVLAQRLVRVLCPDCKKAYEPDPNHLATELPPDFPLDLWSKRDETGASPTIYQPVGCRNCRQRGYNGRRGIFELLTVNENIRDLVVERASSMAIKTEGRRNGLTTLRDDAWRLLLTGQTSVEDVLRVTKADEPYEAEDVA